MTDELQKMIRALCGLRPTLVEILDGKRNQCIACTKIGIEVLRCLGVRAEPVPVVLSVFNPAHAAPILRYLNEHEGQWPSPAMVDAWVRAHVANPVGPRWRIMSIGADGPSGGRGWDGHLVMLVEGQMIVDLTIDQTNRPQYDVVLKPVVIQKLRGLHQVGGIDCGVMNGCLIVYERTDDMAWRSSEAWAQPVEVIAAHLARSIDRKRQVLRGPISRAVDATVGRGLQPWRS